MKLWDSLTSNCRNKVRTQLWHAVDKLMFAVYLVRRMIRWRKLHNLRTTAYYLQNEKYCKVSKCTLLFQYDSERHSIAIIFFSNLRLLTALRLISPVLAQLGQLISRNVHLFHTLSSRKTYILKNSILQYDTFMT